MANGKLPFKVQRGPGRFSALDGIYRQPTIGFINSVDARLLQLSSRVNMPQSCLCDAPAPLGNTRR